MNANKRKSKNIKCFSGFHLRLFALTCMDALMSQAHGAQERPSVGKKFYERINK